MDIPYGCIEDCQNIYNRCPQLFRETEKNPMSSSEKVFEDDCYDEVFDEMENAKGVLFLYVSKVEEKLKKTTKDFPTEYENISSTSERKREYVKNKMEFEHGGICKYCFEASISCCKGHAENTEKERRQTLQDNCMDEICNAMDCAMIELQNQFEAETDIIQRQSVCLKEENTNELKLEQESFKEELKVVNDCFEESGMNQLENEKQDIFQWRSVYLKKETPTELELNRESFIEKLKLLYNCTEELDVNPVENEKQRTLARMGGDKPFKNLHAKTSREYHKKRFQYSFSKGCKINATVLILMSLVIHIQSTYCPSNSQTMKEVTDCPSTEREWEKRSMIFNCSHVQQTCTEPSQYTYHCLLNYHHNIHIEVCAVRQTCLGFCPEYNLKGERVQHNYYKNCAMPPSPCPQIFMSDEAYKYPVCLEKEKTETETETEIGSGKDNADMSTFRTVYLPLAVFIVTIIVSLVIGILCRLRKKRKKNKNAHYAEENIILSDESQTVMENCLSKNELHMEQSNIYRSAKEIKSEVNKNNPNEQEKLTSQKLLPSEKGTTPKRRIPVINDNTDNSKGSNVIRSRSFCGEITHAAENFSTRELVCEQTAMQEKIGFHGLYF